MSIHQHDSNKDAKDAKLLLPADWQARAPLQKIFIDDLTAAQGMERQRVWHVPWFILLMCFIQISMFLVANECMQRRLIYKTNSSHECWRFLTYMLLHADVWHLAINMCLQCFIGVALELEQGHCRLSLVYITGGIFGALASAWLEPDLLLLGASAGIYAMLCSHVPHLVLRLATICQQMCNQLMKNYSQLSHRYCRIAVPLLLLVGDVAFTIYHFCVHQNRNPRISIDAHVGGAVAGIVCGFIVYRRLKSWNYRLSFSN